MQTYSYRAATADGRVEAGRMESASAEAARSALAARALFPLEVRPEAAGVRSLARVSAVDLALGLRGLAVLLESGLPMGRSLAAFEELAPESWKTELPALRETIRNGGSLSGALRQSRIPMPPVVLGMIRAGEAGSGLAVAVGRAADLQESAASARAAVQGALAYPLLLAFAGTASTILLVTVVLPRFAVILADLGQALPPTTRLVLTGAHVARPSALPLAVLAVLGAAVWRRWTATPAGRNAWHGLLLRAPLVGPIRRSLGASRTAAALGALLGSGVPLPAALRYAGAASGDAWLEGSADRVRARVLRGESLSSAFEAERTLTPVAIRLVRAGERAGELARMLDHASRLESARGQQALSRTVRMIEPALILGFGAVVALVAAALLQALYSIRPA